ncbi:hypothetical protein [Sphingobacterium sp. LRF_L2]|uniref:hypothetical protein n=1 Tax=Sphingobacterium sp. LRF_L2 TaxID=3369421 RepID=UPI003F60484F
MKRLLLFFASIFQVVMLCAQHNRIETDIFGNLDYTSRDGKYTATLEKNIFNDLVFSDSKQNKVTLENKYLAKEYAGILGDKVRQQRLLEELIRENRRDEGYQARYAIDIFGSLIVEDNRGYKLEKGTDIFGHDHIEEQVDGRKTSVKRNLNGGLEFTDGEMSASLKKDIFNKWIYEDSLGNRFQFGANSWEKLMRRYHNDEEILMYLIDQFIFY